MKLIDRYLLTSLLTPLIYCIGAFTMIFVVYDLFENLPKFVAANTQLPLIIGYYLRTIPAVLIYIFPISLLLAVLYSLSNLTRNHEIIAMRASGINLYRLIVPFIGVGLVGTALVAIVNETIAPDAAYETHQFITSEKKKATKRKGDAHLRQNFAFNNRDFGRVWFIETFNEDDFSLSGVTVTQQGKTQGVAFEIKASHGLWLDGHWWLRGAEVQHYTPDGNFRGPPEFHQSLELTEFNETPEIFMNEFKDPEFMSSRDLLHYIKTHDYLSQEALAAYRVNFHSRLAMPWTCLVFTLLGIPFGTDTGRKGALQGVALSLILFVALYILLILFRGLGKAELIPAVVAGWGPHAGFTLLAAILIYRMQ